MDQHVSKYQGFDPPEAHLCGCSGGADFTPQDHHQDHQNHHQDHQDRLQGLQNPPNKHPPLGGGPYMYGSEAPEADPGGPGGGSGGLGSGFTKALSVGVVVTWRLLKRALIEESSPALAAAKNPQT